MLHLNPHFLPDLPGHALLRCLPYLNKSRQQHKPRDGPPGVPGHQQPVPVVNRHNYRRVDPGIHLEAAGCTDQLALLHPRLHWSAAAAAEPVVPVPVLQMPGRVARKGLGEGLQSPQHPAGHPLQTGYLDRAQGLPQVVLLPVDGEEIAVPDRAVSQLSPERNPPLPGQQNAALPEAEHLPRRRRLLHLVLQMVHLRCNFLYHSYHPFCLFRQIQTRIGAAPFFLFSSRCAIL